MSERTMLPIWEHHRLRARRIFFAPNRRTHATLAQSPEDHGYNAFIADIDAIVMGRGTFEAVRNTKPWPYHLPVIVLSQQLTKQPVPRHLCEKVRYSDQAPEAVMSMMHAEGIQRVYVDGGLLVQSFLRLGLIADMVVNRVPVLLGTGRPLFGHIPSDIALTHEGTTTFPSGLVQSRYRLGS